MAKMLKTEVTAIIGPPGTGKTETLAKSTRSSVLERGRKVLVASLTNAAAGEIRARTGVKDQNRLRVGTLHKHCMQQLRITQDELAVQQVPEWNARVEKKHPDWVLSVKRRGAEPTAWAGGGTRGDNHLALIDDARHRMLPEPLTLPSSTAAFRAKYETWKDDAGVLDFTDIIAEAHKAPEAAFSGDFVPNALVIDECQDSTPLELDLVRNVWGPKVGHLIMAGDADQSLFSFRGADPGVFLNSGIPPRVLDQSYRVPGAVHDVATRLIRNIPDRIDAQWSPTDNPGEFLRGRGWNNKRMISLEADLKRWLDEGTVMILGATRFQLFGAIALLRSLGIPYWNPWASTRGDWNPIRLRSGGTLARFLSYACPGSQGDDPSDWSHEDMRAWIPLLNSTGVLRRGVAGRLSEIFPGGEDDGVATDTFRDLWVDEATALEALEGDPKFLLKHAKKERLKMLEFVHRIWLQGGKEALEKDPQVTVGSVHSVKGASAHTVILFPDVTWNMWRAAGSQREREAQIRTFYVGMTRAKHRLVIPYPASKLCLAEVATL